jgi:hypothetical protein
VKDGGEFRLGVGRMRSQDFGSLVQTGDHFEKSETFLVVTFPRLVGTIVEPWETSNTDQAVGFFG